MDDTRLAPKRTPVRRPRTPGPLAPWIWNQRWIPGFILAQVAVLLLFADKASGSYEGVPGGLGALISVTAAIVCGPIAGALVSLAGGLVFVPLVTDFGRGHPVLDPPVADRLRRGGGHLREAPSVGCGPLRGGCPRASRGEPAASAAGDHGGPRRRDDPRGGRAGNGRRRDVRARSRCRRAHGSRRRRPPHPAGARRIGVGRRRPRRMASSSDRHARPGAGDRPHGTIDLHRDARRAARPLPDREEDREGSALRRVRGSARAPGIGGARRTQSRIPSRSHGASGRARPPRVDRASGGDRAPPHPFGRGRASCESDGRACRGSPAEAPSRERCGERLHRARRARREGPAGRA